MNLKARLARLEEQQLAAARAKLAAMPASARLLRALEICLRWLERARRQASPKAARAASQAIARAGKAAALLRPYLAGRRRGEPAVAGVEDFCRDVLARSDCRRGVFPMLAPGFPEQLQASLGEGPRP
jgi:hypothetical protein